METIFAVGVYDTDWQAAALAMAQAASSLPPARAPSSSSLKQRDGRDGDGGGDASMADVPLSPLGHSATSSPRRGDWEAQELELEREAQLAQEAKRQAQQQLWQQQRLAAAAAGGMLGTYRGPAAAGSGGSGAAAGSGGQGAAAAGGMPLVMDLRSSAAVRTAQAASSSAAAAAGVGAGVPRTASPAVPGMPDGVVVEAVGGGVVAVLPRVRTLGSAAQAAAGASNPDSPMHAVARSPAVGGVWPPQAAAGKGLGLGAAALVTSLTAAQLQQQAAADADGELALLSLSPRWRVPRTTLGGGAAARSFS